MALTWTTPSGTGYLFYVRIGKLAEAAIHANTYRSTTLPADVVDIASVYTAFPQLLDGLYAQEDSQQASAGGFNQYLSLLALDTLRAVIDSDRAILDRSVRGYLQELLRQQTDASIELDDSPATIGTVTAGGSNIGDAVFVITDRGVDGLPLDTIYPETVRIDCTGGEQQGATEWQEPFTVQGELANSDTLSAEWPDGSGAAATINLVDPSIDGIVTNGSFHNWNSGGTPASIHVPDDWELVTGVGGTDIEVEETETPRGTTVDPKCLRLMGTATDVEMHTVLTGLQPNTLYCVTVKLNAPTLPGNGDIQLQLIDANDAAIDGENSYSNSLVIDTGNGAIDGAWGTFTKVFITPNVLPSGDIKLRLYVYNALDAPVLVSHIQLVPMATMYSGGYSIVGISGTISSKINDRYTSAITVSGTNTSMVRWMERFFNCSQLGVKMRTGTTATTGYTDGALISP